MPFNEKHFKWYFLVHGIHTVGLLLNQRKYLHLELTKLFALAE